MQYSNDAQLAEEDAQLFAHDDRDYTRKHLRAAEDLRRDLAAHGYFRSEGEQLVDTSAQAAVLLRVVAGPAGATLAAGTRVRTRSVQEQRHGDTVFVTQAALVLGAGEVGEVAAQAEDVGEVYNVEAGRLVVLEQEIAGVASVTNPAPATGGADHQLARAAIYRVMELVCMDLMRTRDDAWDHKRAVYQRMYKDEVKRLVAGGLALDRDGDGAATSMSERRAHGFHRFERR
jgi:hypothetical protein